MLKSVPCRGCGKIVYFVKDKTGKFQVLDTVAPVWNVKAGHDPVTGFSSYEAERAGDNTFVSHFSTCSKANLFSKSKQEVATKCLDALCQKS